MKRILSGFAAIAVMISSQGQTWIDVGVKGSWGPNFLYNQNILNDVDYNNLLDYGYSFGGKLGINFDETNEITIDVMSSVRNHKFVHNKQNGSGNNGSDRYHSSLNFRALDLMLLYRGNNNGGYFEIGPQYSILSTASFSDEYENITNRDIKDKVNTGLFGFVMGFGGYFIGTDNFGVTLGARFSYAFSDLINANGQADNLPTLNAYKSYRGTHPFSAMLIMEFNYDLGYLASSKCSKRNKFILF